MSQVISKTTLLTHCLKAFQQDRSKSHFFVKTQNSSSLLILEVLYQYLERQADLFSGLNRLHVGVPTEKHLYKKWFLSYLTKMKIWNKLTFLAMQLINSNISLVQSIIHGSYSLIACMSGLLSSLNFQFLMLVNMHLNN